MLLVLRQIVFHPLALQMPQQRIAPARSALAAKASRWLRIILVVRFFFRRRQFQPGFSSEQRQLLTRELLAFAPALGCQQLAQQTLGAIQLRGHVHQHLLQDLRILRERFRIDRHCSDDMREDAVHLEKNA